VSPQCSASGASKPSVDLFGRTRRVLRQIHLWIALTLCLPMVVVGLTGSILVYRKEIAALVNPPPPPLTCATGKAHTVAEIIKAVQVGIGKDFRPFLYESPSEPGQPATVRLITHEGVAARPRVIEVLVDPVSLNFVERHSKAFPGLLLTVLRLHGNLLMGRAGRAYVGWLGVAMLALGVSGLILWWPRWNRWRAAFVVKRGARGLRLYRDLHGAVGIWTYVVFITVSFSGVYFSFPQPIGAGIRTLLPSRQTSSPGPILRIEGAQRIDVDRAIAIAQSAAPGAQLRSITPSPRPDQPYRVSLARPGDDHGAPEITALIDPWSAKLIELIDPSRFAPAQTVLAWQPVLHFGQGLGWVWRLLVCLSGLLPAVFAVTGVAMWLIKRRARARVRRTAVPRPTG
jgi:uncharacterized iron-regulated membrane protein